MIFNLPDYRFTATVQLPDGARHVTVESMFPPGCPSCGVIASRVKERRCQQLRYIPVAGAVVLLWDKRRWFCGAGHRSAPLPVRAVLPGPRHENLDPARAVVDPLADARTFVSSFVDGYNHAHRHTGIGLSTPADVHYGLASGKAMERAKTLAIARAKNPERFATNKDPKVLALPVTAWINNPAERTTTKEAA